MKLLVAQIHSITGGTESSKSMFKDGVNKAIEIINSQEFKDAVINYSWKDVKGNIHNNFYQNKSTYTELPSGKIIERYLSNQEIYDLIMTGWDQFHQTEDGDLDLQATIYYKAWSSAVGYTYPDTFATWINQKFWTGSYENIVAMISGNVTHEYKHNLGFDHDYDWTIYRDFSVPYAIGTIVHQLAKGIYVAGKNHSYKQVCSRNWKTLFLTRKCSWVRVDE